MFNLEQARSITGPVGINIQKSPICKQTPQKRLLANCNKSPHWLGALSNPEKESRSFSACDPETELCLETATHWWGRASWYKRCPKKPKSMDQYVTTSGATAPEPEVTDCSTVAFQYTLPLQREVYKITVAHRRNTLGKKVCYSSGIRRALLDYAKGPSCPASCISQ